MKEDVFQSMNAKMDKAIASFQKELHRLRTGRASPALLEGIRVDYYGTPTPIQQTANVTIPESRLIVIQPWDKGMLETISKGIQKANLGLSPSNDGNVIRIAIPPLTEERRKELVKVVHKIAEEYKVSIRNIRRDSNEMVKELKKDGQVSEDDAFKSQEKIQKITDEHIRLVDDCYAEKEKEILEF